MADDCAIQAIGHDEQEVKELYNATEAYMSDLKQLKMTVQPSKSGYFATSTVFTKLVEPYARKLGII